MRIVVHVDGGIVERVLFDKSDEPVEVMVIDHDIDGMDEDRISATSEGRAFRKLMDAEESPGDVNAEYLLETQQRGGE